MKKSGNKSSKAGQRRSVFERFTGGDKESPIAGNTPDRQIRHVESPVNLGSNGLTESFTDTDGYGHAEDMHVWGMNDKKATLRTSKRNVFLGLGIAIGVIILMLAGVFYILPRVLPKLFAGTNIELFVQKQVNYVYTDPSYRVINLPEVSVYASPSVTSDRITQVLYNEVITLKSEQVTDGFVQIETQDKITGYIKDGTFISEMDSAEPDLYQYKLIISSPYKNIMTHASNGTLITKAMMNTALYGNVKRDGVYQVTLPGGDTGWVGSSGVIEIGTRATTDIVSSRYFVSSVLTFVNSMYLDDGLTMQGASVNGIAYVCSSVNGIELPRSMIEQSRLGNEIELHRDAVNNNLVIDDIHPGDFVFLRGADDPASSTEIKEMAICTDTGTFFMISPAKTTVRLRQFSSGNSFYERIITVRRFFQSD